MMAPEFNGTQNTHIDTEDQVEIAYIAQKLGCEISDILLAVKTLKTTKRINVYSWIIDRSFKSVYSNNLHIENKFD